MNHLLLLSAMLAAWFLAATNAVAQTTTSRLSSRFLARGEQALLEIAVFGREPTAAPAIPAVNGVEIRAVRREAVPRQTPGRRMEYCFEYLVSSYQTGNHTFPALDLTVAGDKTRTEPIEFTVFNPDELQWAEASVGGKTFRYASAFRSMNVLPYEGETTPVEIKLFVPSDLFVDDWGIPDFQRDGVTAWRFQPSMMRGQINLLGMPYVSVAYPSTLTPTRSGKVGIGPASIRLVTTDVIMDGRLRRVFSEVNLAVPKLELSAALLPPGAPEGFENAVGSFRLSARSMLTDVVEGDPIPVETIVSGSGNLDTLLPPKPIDIDGWKIYEPTSETRGDERRELSGTTIFKQFLRPLELKPAVPAFRLVYFDPKQQAYQTLTTEPIPLQMSPAPAVKETHSGPPPQRAIPVERMSDILANLQPASLIQPTSSTIPNWLGHALAGLAALALIAKALWMRHAHRFRKDPLRTARMTELREIERMKSNDETDFLMSIGRFIERWLADSPSLDIQALLAERDANCFRHDRADKARPIDPKRRNAILRTLRKAAFVWLVASCYLVGTSDLRASEISQKAQAAYDSAKFNDAIAYWLSAGPYESLAPDTLYNIANACYRAGSPGHAALYYRRALDRNPSHPESRQNLRFIERKYGAITIHRPDYQYALARFPLVFWQDLLWSGLWLCVLAALVFPATRQGARIRLVALAALVISPLLAASGGLGWRYFPIESEFAPLARQAVIVSENAVLYADASRTSPEVIDAPPGSICEVIRSSGSWAYVAFATRTRGWIPAESIELIIPNQAPVPPKIRKPKADGKSA